MVHRRWRISLFAAVFVGFAVPTPALRAADVWDNSSGDADWFNALNWADDSVPTSSDGVALPVHFPGGDTTISLGAATAEMASLNFADSYTLSGGATLVDNGEIHVFDNMTATIASALGSGTPNGINKTGNGTLIVNTPSTQFGYHVSVAAGTLRVEHAHALGTSGTGTATVFGTLELANVSLDREVTLAGGNGTLAGAGTSALTGKLRAGFGQRSILAVADGAKLTIGNAVNDLTGGGGSNPSISVLASGGGVGTGIVTLNNASDVVAHWSLEGGILDISADNELGAASNNVTLAGGQLRTTLHDFSTARTITPAGGSISVNAKNYTLTTGLGAGDGSLTTLGGGRLILQAASARTGATNVNAGIVRLEDAAALGSGPIALNGPGRIEVADVAVNQPLAAGLRARITGFGNAAWIGPITIDPTGSLFVNGNAMGDMLTLGDGTFALNGSATSRVTISAAQFPGGTVALPYPTGYPGGWIITGQTARVGHSQALGTGTSAIDVAGSGTLELMPGVTLSRDIDLGGSSAVRASGGSASVNGAISVGAGGIFGISVRLGTISPGDVLAIHGALTDGSSNTLMRIDGPGTVLLAQPGTVVTQGWDVESGTLRLDASGALGGANTRIDVGGRALFNAPQTIGLVEIRAGGDVDLAPGEANVLSADMLAFNSLTSKLDIADNAVAVRSPSFGVGTWSDSGYAGGPGYTSASGLIQWGRNNGMWDRDGGITTSMSDAPTGLTSIGVATASQVLGIGQTDTATWRGQSVTGDDTLIAYTYAGDANLDGKINIDDYGRIDGNVAQSGSVFGWFNGDFNYDGKINIDDYGIIDGNINQQGEPFDQAALSHLAPTQRVDATSAVPEPSTAAALAAVATMALARRSRFMNRGRFVR